MSDYSERYWRDAQPEDATKPQLMVARFKYYPDGFPGNWEIATDLLGGFTRSRWGNIVEWFDSSGNRFNNAQVYDAPDPGEGWRLVDVEKDVPLEGDEIYERETCSWRRRLTPFQPWAVSINRRRIEQPKPEPRYEPFRWEDREQLRGRLITYVDCNVTVELRCESFTVDHDTTFAVDYVNADWLCKHAVFVDTKEPVGRKIQ